MVIEMGRRVTQRILECAICEKTPEDGEYLWEMCGEYWCEECCDKDHEAEEIPQLHGTRVQLNTLGV
jgi:hypothetical protein